MSVTPRGMSIQEAYREYRAGNFNVNRRYQRKLVWTVAEKAALVDSVLKRYPIPLVLLGFILREDGTKRFEILDGMQRLNALFSFIENQFGWEGKYFDVGELSRAKQLADEGEFIAVTDTERLLSPQRCADFLDYTLAVTEFPAHDEESVNDVFGRINSSGRQLSPQEKRQAGVVTPFASAIRELASEIRGDVSHESLDLSAMPSISVDVAGESPENSIKAADTLWCRQGVLRRRQLRDSEDEQMLADLAVSILKGEPYGFSGAMLDSFYDPDSPDSTEINELLASYGATELKHHITATLSILRSTIEEVDDSAGALPRVVHPGAGANPIKTDFYAVFNAFFDLCVRQRKTPDSAAAVMEALRNLHDRLKVSAGQIRSAQRVENVNVTKGLIQDCFIDADPPALDHGAGAAIDFENALRRSRIETSAWECKQGLLDLGARRQLQAGLLDRIVETICGIANIGPSISGALLIGVADNETDSQRVHTLDRVSPAHVGSRFVVGVDREAAILGENLEAYYRRVMAHISTSGLSNPLRSAVLAKMDCISYRGFSVICLWVPAQAAVSSVNDNVFVRRGSSTHSVSGLTETQAVLARFS